MNTKYLRINIIKNTCPKLMGLIGLTYESYREISGPETFSICLYFFYIEIEIGPRFS